MINLTPVIEAFVALVAALISAFVIPWLKRKTAHEDRQEMLQWVEIAVSAAEQLFDVTDGKAKKKAVEAFLREQGYTFSESELDNAIEAAVLKLHAQLEDVK